MITDIPRRQISDFCRKHHIIQFWLVDEAFDAPLPDQLEIGNTPTAIVTFRRGKVPDFSASSIWKKNSGKPPDREPASILMTG